MSPIEGLSEIVRLPRLGKIRLGEKVKEPGKNPYPCATDHFVVPPEVAGVFGEKPTELPIMFPTDDPQQFAQQWLRAYSLTQGLVCIGDALNCRRKVDLDTGAMASHTTQKWEWRDGLTCDPQECPEYLSKRCRRVLNLQFILPDVPGLGVWQIDTTSFYSILNINSMVSVLKEVVGRCRMIPLTLALGPVEVNPPGLKKKTVYIMHLKKDIKWADLARLAQLPPARVLLPEPETEEPPEELFPREVLAEAESPPTAEQPQSTGRPEPTMDDLLGEGPDGDVEELEPEEETPRVRLTPATTKQIETLRRLAPQVGYRNWGWFRERVVKQYNLASFDDLTFDMAEDAIDKLHEAVRRRRQEF
jgi:hypothetical protein